MTKFLQSLHWETFFRNLMSNKVGNEKKFGKIGVLGYGDKMDKLVDHVSFFNREEKP